MLAPHVFKIHIDSVRGCFCQRLGQVSAGLVVDGGVDATFIFQPLCLAVTAYAAHYATAQLLGNLADDSANRTRGGGNEYGFPRFWFTEFLQADIGSKSGHTKSTEIERQPVFVERLQDSDG